MFRRLPVVVDAGTGISPGAVGWLPLLLALRLTEPPVERLHAAAGHASNILRVVRHLLLSDRVLRLTLLAICVWGLTTFYAVWLIQKLWGQQGIDFAHLATCGVP